MLNNVLQWIEIVHKMYYNRVKYLWRYMTMNTMRAIRNKQKIEEFKSALMKKSYRDYMLFVLGINTGFRIQDILDLKVKRVKNSHINIRENKTDKEKSALIQKPLRDELDRYISGMSDEDYLFPSQKGENKPISRVQAYRILNEVAQSLGLEMVGCHTMRKTYGYWHYQQFHDVILLQKWFNHSAPSVTLRYIDVDQDLMDEAQKEFFL
jgi:integrase